MPDEPTLLRAVIEAPDVDAPRIAYAAWCESQSDAASRARARFIRIQLELATLGSGAKPHREYDLGQEALKLENAGRSTWDRNVLPLTRSTTYRRGFIELVEMSAESFLKRGAALLAQAPIRHLNLTAARTFLGDLLAGPLLDEIRSLSLIDCGLDDGCVADLAASPHLAQLRWLSLARNAIGEDGVESIARSELLPHLAWVNLAGNAIEPNEQYSFDNGFVVDAGLPEIGQRLEARLGRLPWLRHAAKTLSDQVPDRFRIQPPFIKA